MEIVYSVAVYFCLIMSLACIIAPFIIALRYKAKTKERECRQAPLISTNKFILLVSAILLASIWFLRYAVGLYRVKNGCDGLNFVEELFNSLVHALQSFSMDEDYTQYIKNGKAMIRELPGGNDVFAFLYGIYASILNVIAPIAGGAIIFEVLMSISPKLRLYMSYANEKRDKYFFSELNERSLALAKSIYSDSRLSGGKYSPVLVFTDTYINEDDEKSAEVLLEAKAMGAICIKDDISNVRKNKKGGRKFFLIDTAEMDNLQTLALLSNEDNYIYLSNADIYLFSHGEIYTHVEKQVVDKLTKRLGRENLPIIHPIQSYRNLVTNLLVELPLYEPIVHKKPDENGVRDLYVTILGTGSIGTEMLLSAYWCGQMLDCRLHLTVISKEAPESFEGRLNYINPDIIESTKENSSMLVINDREDMADTYATIDYICADVKRDSIDELLSNKTYGAKTLRDTDYFVVALGSDEDNLDVARNIKKAVGKDHLLSDEDKKTVIAYVIYDSDLCQSLNHTARFNSGKNGCDIYMRAFGSLSDVYSTGNIFMLNIKPLADQVADSYYNINARSEQRKAFDKRVLDDYQHWSNLARGIHKKYKVFSSGVVEKSVFDYRDGEEEKMAADFENAVAMYKLLIAGEGHNLELMHKLAWLEHRRWNAFMRVKGFRQIDNYVEHYKKTGSHKNIELKLHSCLVECDKRGIRAEFDKDGRIIGSSVFKCEDQRLWDRLDKVTYGLKGVNPDAYDFKQYDYPIDDYND